MGLLTELKRRNVFRVGLAYVLIAWVLLQAADFGLDLIGAPNWVIQSLFLLAAIGLPAALVFAWVFEMTPEGIKLEKDVDRSTSITPSTGRRLDRVIIAFLAITVAFMVASRYWAVDPDDAARRAAPTGSGTERGGAEQDGSSGASTPSIAVLPFVDMSPEGDQAYFSDGIAEEILNVLVKTDRLRVAGRTSSFQFRGRNDDLRMIGQQLGVEHILEGSVRKAKNRVRITAQLVKAKDGFHLWSETYDRELDDIFAVQDEIAQAITGALAIHLDLGDEPLVKASTANMQAYENYLAARSLITARTDFERARQLLGEATRLDPEFAPAWSSHAQVLALLYYYEPVHLPVVLTEAEAMARRALELDPMLSSAHSVMGDIHRDRGDWLAAKVHYERALALNPSDIEANSQFGQMWLRLGYFSRAMTYTTVAVELDPLSWINQTLQATVLYMLDDREAAWTHMQRSFDSAEEYRDFQLRQAIRMALSDGDRNRAIELMRLLTDSQVMLKHTAEVTARVRQFVDLLDDPEAALEYISKEYAGRFDSGNYSQWEVGNYTLWELEMFWAVELGDNDLAAQILNERSIIDSAMAFVDSSWIFWPGLKPLFETHPALLKRVMVRAGAVNVWRQIGFPNHCRPLGEEDFECD